jgi:hypothetical protein
VAESLQRQRQGVLALSHKKTRGAHPKYLWTDIRCLLPYETRSQPLVGGVYPRHEARMPSLVEVLSTEVSFAISFIHRPFKNDAWWWQRSLLSTVEDECISTTRRGSGRQCLLSFFGCTQEGLPYWAVAFGELTVSWQRVDIRWPWRINVH